MFFQKKTPEFQTPPEQATALIPISRKAFDEIGECACELIVPPDGLVAAFHFNRIETYAREEAAIAEVRQRIDEEKCALAAVLLGPQAAHRSFGERLREAVSEADGPRMRR